jgi:hypothetical protein
MVTLQTRYRAPEVQRYYMAAFRSGHNEHAFRAIADRILRADMSDMKKKGNRKTMYILYTNGSYNPVHDMHVKLLVFAREAIEKKRGKNSVVGAFFAGMGDDYIPKKKEHFVPTVRAYASWLIAKRPEL